MSHMHPHEEGRSFCRQKHVCETENRSDNYTLKLIVTLACCLTSQVRPIQLAIAMIFVKLILGLILDF